MIDAYISFKLFSLKQANCSGLNVVNCQLPWLQMPWLWWKFWEGGRSQMSLQSKTEYQMAFSDEGLLSPLIHSTDK